MRWFARNRWYLAALAALIPAAIVVSLSAGWFGYAEAQRGRPTIVEGTATVDYAGAQWSLLEWHAFDASSNAGKAAGLLAGTSIVTATVGVTPGAEPPSCAVDLLDSVGYRSWNEAGYSDADFEISDDAQSYCDSSAPRPYKLQVFFLVPADATERPQLRLSVLTLLPDTLLFQL